LILGETSKSEQYRYFQLLLGYKELTRVVADLMKEDKEFTKLRPNLVGIDPDDAFSIVPYEKGCLFLFHLETKVGGPGEMKGWLHSLYSTYRTKSYTSDDMRAHCEKYFTEKGKGEALKEINWNAWFDGEGMPPFDPTAALTTSLSEDASNLAKKWIQFNSGETHAFSKDDIKEFKPSQLMYLLDEIMTSPAMPLKAEVVAQLDKTYQFSSSVNVEIAYRVQLLALHCKMLEIIPIVDEFLGKVGRGRYVKVLYNALNELDHAKAVEIYHRRKIRYHSVIRNYFDGTLKA